MELECVSAGRGGEAVAERSEVMKRQRNPGHSAPTFFPPEKNFVWQVDSDTDGGLGETKFREA